MLWIAHRCNDWDTINHEIHHAHMLEVDIVITKNNNFVLCHDLDCNNLIVSQHSSSSFPSLITLPELLRKVHIPIYLDIKWDPRVDPIHTANQLYETLKPFKKRWNNFYLFTFDVQLLSPLRDVFGHAIHIGWLIEDVALWDPYQDCDIVSVDYEIAHLIFTHRPVFVFTVNDLSCLRHIERVDGIVSDKVCLLKAQVEKEATSS